MIACQGVSASGLFEIIGEVLVEGDCITRSRVHRFRMATLATSEAAQAYLNNHHDYHPVDVYGPANYVARHKKLLAIQAANRAAMVDRMRLNKATDDALKLGFKAGSEAYRQKVAELLLALDSDVPF